MFNLINEISEYVKHSPEFRVHILLPRPKEFLLVNNRKKGTPQEKQ